MPAAAAVKSPQLYPTVRIYRWQPMQHYILRCAPGSVPVGRVREGTPSFLLMQLQGQCMSQVVKEECQCWGDNQDETWK